VSDGLPRLEVNPDLGIVLDRRVRDQTEFVSVGEAIHIPVASGEDGAVYR